MECPIGYEVGKAYSREEMIELLKSVREFLCFYALTTQTYVLGVDFEHYSVERKSVPVHGLPRSMVKEIESVEGKGFKRAVAESGRGKSVVVTWDSASNTGWVALRWQVGEVRVYQSR